MRRSTRIDLPPVIRTAFGAAVAFALSAWGGRAGAATPASPASSPEAIEFFEKHVRPVLADNCYKCHSTASGKSKGGLLLDTKDAMLKGGENGPAVVPGDPDKSRLIEAVRYANPDLQMPPKGKGQPLSPEQVADLVAWVKMARRTRGPAPGGVAGGGRPATTSPPPASSGRFIRRSNRRSRRCGNRTGRRGAIDRFILARLEEKGLKPAPAADRRTLIRRATFDLTGLPPTPEEVEAFVDDASPRRLRQGRRPPARLARSTASAGAGTGSTWSATPTRSDARGIKGGGPTARCLALPRLGRRRLQPRPALRPVRDEPDRRRPAAAAGGRGGSTPTGSSPPACYAIGEWGAGDADKEKMLTDIVDDQVDVIGRAFLGPDARLRPLPRPQVRPDPAGRLLLPGRHLLQHPHPPRPRRQDRRLADAADPAGRPVAVGGEEAGRPGDRGDAAEDRSGRRTRRTRRLAASLLPETDKYLLAAAEYARRPADKRRGDGGRSSPPSASSTPTPSPRWVDPARPRRGRRRRRGGRQAAGRAAARHRRHQGSQRLAQPGPSGTPVALANTHRPADHRRRR